MPCVAVPLEGLRADDRLGERVDRRAHLLLALAEGELDGHGGLSGSGRSCRQTKAFCDSALGSTSAGIDGSAERRSTAAS